MNQNNTKEFTFADFASLLKRNLWLIVLACIIGTLGGYVLSNFIISPKYETEIGFMLIWDETGGASDTNTGLTYAQKVVYNCVEIMQNNEYLDTVSQEILTSSDADVAQAKEILASSGVVEKNDISNYLKKNITYTTTTNTSSITATILTKNAQLSYGIAKAMGNVTATELNSVYDKIEFVTHHNPELAKKASSPNVALYTVAGFVGGAIIIVLVLLVSTFADSRIKSEEDFIEEFHLPMMGVVPVFPQTKEQQDELKSRSKGSSRRVFNLISEDTPFSIVEAFRNIKTNVCFSIPKKSEKAARVICVTSSEMSEGKSTISCNTALTFAQSKMKTLLIDADLRKPKVNKFFKSENKLGLSDCLSGEATSNQIINKTKFENLFTIVAGTLPPNPIELLSSEGMVGFVNEQKGNFDVIIIDTPPLDSVSDCLVLSTVVDGALVVIKHRKTTVADVYATLRKTGFAKLKILGMVLNCYSERGVYGYGYKYAYKYGYDYKYGDNGKNSKEDED